MNALLFEYFRMLSLLRWPLSSPSVSTPATRWTLLNMLWRELRAWWPSIQKDDQIAPKKKIWKKRNVKLNEKSRLSTWAMWEYFSFFSFFSFVFRTYFTQQLVKWFFSSQFSQPGLAKHHTYINYLQGWGTHSPWNFHACTAKVFAKTPRGPSQDQQRGCGSVENQGRGSIWWLTTTVSWLQQEVGLYLNWKKAAIFSCKDATL